MRKKDYVCVRVCVRGCFQLTGNLFLPFSLNKGCDWLLCVHTDLQHGGDEKADHSKVTEAPNIRTFPQQNSALFHTQITTRIPWCWPQIEIICVSRFASRILTEKKGKFFHLPSEKNVNKPAHNYNNLQPSMEAERETPSHINVKLRLSEGATSLNLSYQALDEGCTQLCMCKPAQDSAWCAYGSVRCSDRFSATSLKHVDAIRCFCSTLKSANTGSRGGGRDTQEEQRLVRRDRRKERRSEEKNIRQGSL